MKTQCGQQVRGWGIPVAPLKEPLEEIRSGKTSAINLCRRILEFAWYGDYSNGNVVFGVDEGRERARRKLEQFDRDWQAIKGE